MRQKLFLNFFLCVLVLLGGCGYTTKAFFLPSDIKTVFIDTFSNKTDQPNLENELRTKLVRTFQNDGNLKIGSLDDADAVLKGELTGYSRSALRYANNEDIEEYRLSVTVNFEFSYNKTKEIIIKAADFSGDTSFNLTGAQAKQENTARADALEDISRRILNKIITLW